MHANKQEPEECLHKRYTIYHIYDTRYTIYIWYMDMLNVFMYGPCHSLSFAFIRFRFIFIFISNFILFVCFSLSPSLSLSVCGSCGFQQKSIIYVMAKHCRDPQTGDWGDCGDCRDCCCWTVCCVPHRTSNSLLPFFAFFCLPLSTFSGFSLRFCICAVNCTSHRGVAREELLQKGVNSSIEFNL